MKKYFVIMLLMTVCVGLIANESVSPNAIINDSSVLNREMWDVLFTFETSGSNMLGVETDGVNIYTSDYNAGIFTRYDMNGVSLGDFSIAGVTNIRDMAYDGTYFYGSSVSSTIIIMDLANETLIGTIYVNCSGINNVRHIAFDPELDGGTGGFWIGSGMAWGAVAMDGLEIHSNLAHPSYVWGSAYDPWTQGGPYIWLFSYEGGIDATLHQFEIATLSLTGVTHVATDIPGASSPAVAGGLATYVNDDDVFVMLANLQQDPNLIGVYEISEVTPPGYIEGTVTLNGGTGDVQSIVVTAGNKETNPDVDGNYSIEIQQGTYDVTATLEGYSIDTVIDVIVEEGVTTYDVDLILVYLDSPQNLAVDEVAGLFTWDAPVSGNPTGYDIYLDSEFLGNITDTEFQFEDLVNEQTYLAGVSAVYNNGTSEIIEISFTYTPILNPPTSLEMDEATGLFTWDAPVSGNLTGYDVYLDSAFLENVTDTEFQFVNLIFEQTYLAGVSAVYDYGISEIVEISFTYTPILYPPSNVLVDESEGIISWEEPILTNSRDLLGYDVYLDGQLEGSTSDFEWQYIDLVSNQNYTAGIIAIYDEGSSEIVEIDFTYTGTDAGNSIISSTNLIGNYPNPFNPTTTISFSIAQTSSFVNLEIYNLKGQKVKTLVNEKMSAGIHQIVWNGDDENNKPVSSGIYFYKLKSGVYTSTKKMILMK